jgi:hypothetical protein
MAVEAWAPFTAGMRLRLLEIGLIKAKNKVIEEYQGQRKA